MRFIYISFFSRFSFVCCHLKMSLMREYCDDRVFETVRSKTGLATAEDKARAATIANGGGGDAQQKATTNVSPTLSATEDA